MRRTIKGFAEVAARTLPIQEPIVEFGALQVPGQEQFADLRPLFPGKQYIGADMREGLGVDRVLNLHDIALESDSVGTILSLDTLEHVEFPHKAVAEMHRVLKPNGIAILSSVMDFPIHDFPYDYWRFTPEAFRSIMRPFANVFVGYAGRSNFPHTIVGVGFKGATPDLTAFERDFAVWKQRQNYLWNLELPDLVKQFTPPVAVPVFSRVYGWMRGARARRD
ncbi:MAG TPA: methyltransferase domain-containing protein [Thermoanaerobaculia bacterium]|nr:methyltransferase domain-containing protein [Thermoanaerobaculia bacterium]